MKVLMWVIIILLIVVVLLLFLGSVAAYAIAASLAANIQDQNKPNNTILLIENLLGLRFEDDFEVTEFSSRPLHPDQPLKIRLKLGNKLMERIKSFVDQSEPTVSEDIDEKKKIKYSTIIANSESSFTLNRTSFYISDEFEDQAFFRSQLSIDLDKRELSFDEITFV